MKIEVDIYSCYGAEAEVTAQELEVFVAVLQRLRVPPTQVEEHEKQVVSKIQLLLA